MPRYLPLLFTGVASAAFHQAAYAQPKQVTITASVPESCRLDASAIVLTQDSLSGGGHAWEACNSRRSYQIAATTRALAPTELVTISYDSRSQLLDPSGQTGLINRRGPIFKRVPISLTANGLTSALTLSVSMTVI